MTGARGRPARQDEVRQERRRRRDDTIDGSQRLKLAIPEDVAVRLKAEGRTPRWINDDGNRMHNLTKLDDYDKVPGVPRVPVGNTKEGKPIYAYLCSKPTAFIEEDRAEKDEARKEMEHALLRGKNPDDPITGNSAFYADPANKIQHGDRKSP